MPPPEAPEPLLAPLPLLPEVPEPDVPEPEPEAPAPVEPLEPAPCRCALPELNSSRLMLPSLLVSSLWKRAACPWLDWLPLVLAPDPEPVLLPEVPEVPLPLVEPELPEPEFGLVLLDPLCAIAELTREPAAIVARILCSVVFIFALVY